MPKKAATARNGAQRTKAKTQKHFEIVLQDSEEVEPMEEEQVEVTSISTPTPSSTEASETVSRPARSARRAAARASLATQEAETETEVIMASSSAKGSAAARLAARRGQKAQQRSNATLITAEHYTYVTRDLKIIAVLASLMFIAIIVLYFTIGR